MKRPLNVIFCSPSTYESTSSRVSAAERRAVEAAGGDDDDDDDEEELVGGDAATAAETNSNTSACESEEDDDDDDDDDAEEEYCSAGICTVIAADSIATRTHERSGAHAHCLSPRRDRCASKAARSMRVCHTRNTSLSVKSAWSAPNSTPSKKGRACAETKDGHAARAAANSEAEEVDEEEEEDEEIE